MNSSQLQKIYQTISKRITCPRCGKKYSFENIHILSAMDSICFLRLECENHFPLIVTVAIDGKVKPKDDAAVSIDQVIETGRKLSKIKRIENLFK